MSFSGAEVSEKGFARGWDPNAQDQDAQRSFRNTQILEAAVFRPFAWRPHDSIDLKYAFYGGWIDDGAAWAFTPDGDVELQDDVVNYVERTPLGAVSVNAAGFTPATHIPMATITTKDGQLLARTYVDSRPASPVATGGGGGGCAEFLCLAGQIQDGQVPATAVLQYNGLLDHGPLQGLAGDDHLQYLLLVGRAGGQVAFGSPLTTESLTLQGNSSGVDPGFVNLNSPVIFGPYSANPLAAYGFDYDAVEAFTAVFVGGGLNFSGTISFTNPTFIYESFRGAPEITTLVNPGFAAYTVLQALPALVAGPGAGNNPLSPLVVNAGVSVTNPFSGARTTATMLALNWSGLLRTTLSGAVMNVTNFTAVVHQPKFSTVAGSTISFGIIRGLWAQNPAPGLFQPALGTETMVAYYALDVEAIPFGGAVPKAAVRSAITVAVDAWLLLNTGGAWSDFGDGDIHFNDNALIRFGGAVQVPDAAMYWDGVDLILNPHFSAPTPAKVVIPFGGIRVEADAFPVSDFIRRASSVNLILSSWRLTGQSSGDMVDGFGTALFWTIEDDAAVKNNIAFNSAERAGADNSGLYRLRVYTLGVANQIYEASRLTFTVTARAKVQGANALVPVSPAQITADQDDYQGQGSGTAMRGLLRLSTDASRTITGIDATTVDFSEADDELRLVNIGSFDLVLGHQDVGSLATNRIISPTGADLTLGPDEMALLWYDGATARWRILETTGA